MLCAHRWMARARTAEIVRHGRVAAFTGLQEGAELLGPCTQLLAAEDVGDREGHLSMGTLEPAHHPQRRALVVFQRRVLDGGACGSQKQKGS